MRDPVAALSDPALSRFRGAVARAYGERLDRIVLFGSRARGDARPDSDHDVAVFPKAGGTRSAGSPGSGRTSCSTRAP